MQEKLFKQNNWVFKTLTSHILPSQCSNGNCNVCDYCKYIEILNHHGIFELPEMVFSKNMLCIELYDKDDVNSLGDSIFEVTFTALNALKKISLSVPEFVKVSYADEWLNTREEPVQKLLSIVKPYDWTFTTTYQGDVNYQLDANYDNLINQPGQKDVFFKLNSQESIDYALLQEPFKILFYDHIDLYEDELGDNGISKCDVKIRVTQFYWFTLLRFFLRVDSVLIKSNETRYFHKFGSNYILKEHTEKELKLDKNDSEVPTNISNIDQVCAKIPVKSKQTHKCMLPS